MNQEYSNFGDFIAKKREEKQITLRDMAKGLDITAPYLSDVEKDRRNAFDLDKLDTLAKILNLSDEDKILMYDLAGQRRNTIAPDLPGYIMERDYVTTALRTARDLDATEEEWLWFMDHLKKSRDI
jgi:Predicted transcriptional regulators